MYFKMSDPNVGLCGSEPFGVFKINAMHWFISSTPSATSPTPLSLNCQSTYLISSLVSHCKSESSDEAIHN